MIRIKDLFYIDNKLMFNIYYIDEEKNKKLSAQLKLLNINGYAQYALEDYSGKVECIFDIQKDIS